MDKCYKNECCNYDNNEDNNCMNFSNISRCDSCMLIPPAAPYVSGVSPEITTINQRLLNIEVLLKNIYDKI